MSGETGNEIKQSTDFSSNISLKSILKRSVHTLEWKLKNFGLILDRNYEISSPIFRYTRNDSESLWRFFISSQHEYPRGTCLAICLVDMCHHSEVKVVKYKLCVASNKGVAIFLPSREKVFRKFEDFNECGSITHAELAEKRILFDGNLTIRCEIEELLLENEKSIHSRDHQSEGGFNPATNCFPSVKTLEKQDLEYHETKLNNLDCAPNQNFRLNSSKTIKDFKITDVLKGKVNEDPTDQDGRHSEEDIQRLSDDFSCLYANKTFSDMVLVTNDGHSIHVHKAVLWARSHYFRKLCSFKNCNPKNNKIRVPDVKSSVLEAIIFYLYTGRIRQSGNDFYVEVLSASKKFQLQSLEKLLERKLLVNSDDENEVLVKEPLESNL